MLRRTRFLLPAVAVFAVLVTRLSAAPVVAVLLLVVPMALAVDHVLLRVEQRRLRTVADRVVAFAADVTVPPELGVEGGVEWQRMNAALRQVADVLRERLAGLKEERERVERVLEAIPASVLLFSNGILAYANPAAHTTFGLHDAVGPLTPLRALGVASLAEAIEEVAETGRPVTVEVARDGRDLVAGGSRVAAGEVALIVSDQTDLRRVEAMRRDFVANASHELKTPVTGMQALADSLHMAMERDPDRAQRMVERIQSEATRMARLVRDLLDLTRLEEQNVQSRQRVDIHALAVAQVERLRDIAAEAEVTLSCQGQPNMSVVGIAEDLKLILGNLVMNAIKYNRPGGSVAVSVRRERGDIIVNITDTGIGIREADQDRIFERFYRVDKARSRAAGGTGLGLSLVRNAADRHGGSVRVRSVLGEGSTFTVCLPVDGGMGET